MMKNVGVVVIWLLLGWSVEAQEEKIGIKIIEKEHIRQIDVLSSGTLRCGYIYHRFDTFEKTKKRPKEEIQIIEHLPVASDTKDPAFKVYELNADQEQWYRTQDIYSSLMAKVPSIRISSTRMGQNPRIAIRGDENTIVIVDGVRYDTSILRTLNPQDIQSIKVSADPIAATYFIANQN